MEQSLEKLAKGLYNYCIDDNIPRVHNISFILNKVLIVLKEDADEEIFDLFDKLSAYYLQGRYTSFKEKISEFVDKNEAKKILKKSQEVFQWIIRLSQKY